MITTTTTTTYTTKQSQAAAKFGAASEPWCRDVTLDMIHHAICVFLPLIRLQVRAGNDTMSSLALNTFVYEMMLNAADANNLVVDGVHLADQDLFTSAMVMWAVGLFVPLLLVPDWCYTETTGGSGGGIVLVTRWSKFLDMVYATLVFASQDAARLAHRAIVVFRSVLGANGDAWRPERLSSYAVFWAGKNSVLAIFYIHRLYAIARQKT